MKADRALNMLQSMKFDPAMVALQMPRVVKCMFPLMIACVLALPHTAQAEWARASGGDIEKEVIWDGAAWGIHIFTNTVSSSLHIVQAGELEYLVVGGGGAGGRWNNWRAGGGGGGGEVKLGTTNVVGDVMIPVEVGAGGQAVNSDSTVSGSSSSLGSITAAGGGGGGPAFADGAAGGSGGGAGGHNDQNRTGGSSTASGGGLGNAGGDTTGNGGAGGGGAGGEGASTTANPGAAGGAAYEVFITGESMWVGGGGGGGSRSSDIAQGGINAGNGGYSGANVGSSAVANRGGGGGGGGHNSSGSAIGGHGGSGIVVVRHLLGEVGDMLIMRDGSFQPAGTTALLPVTAVDVPVSQTFVVTNLSSDTAITLTSDPRVVFENDATTYNGFTVSTNITAGSIAAEGSASFTITFSSSYVGSYTSTVTIANSDTDPYTIDVVANVAYGPRAMGGNDVQSYVDAEGIMWYAHIFTEVGEHAFEVNAPMDVEVLVVGADGGSGIVVLRYQMSGGTMFMIF